MESRGIVILVLAIVLRDFTCAEAERKVNFRNVEFTETDVAPENELTKLAKYNRGEAFIGDLVIGNRRADETVFWRTVEISNPTDEVYSTVITASVNHGVIHYLSAVNNQGSYAVACDEPYTLGTSKSSFKVRVVPNSKSTLSLVIAAH
ncbi:uncharacterized protein LOC105697484 [Orussus abietinus]|uniref:uncharacterized protein LOC105697484 n=1 Tax=Orussus abietinus TaxID=222816 RepID=UPI000626C0AC|nr:uncharacterized protein LOC105697484 [Orussus abietinus]